MSEKTITHTFKVEPKPGWPCPACRGMGNMGDGSGGMSHDAQSGEVTFTYTAPTPCDVCKGKGRVKVLPLDD